MKRSGLISLLCVGIIAVVSSSFKYIIADNEVKSSEPENMVLIKEGEFEMGCKDFQDAKPAHKVFLSAYYIDKYEVTNEQYAEFLNKYGKDTDDEGNKMIYEHRWGLKKVGKKWAAQTGYEKNPVINITWYGANQYARFNGKRLPTEAEWEKAASGGSKEQYHFGNDESKLGEYAWYSKNSKERPHQVGQKKPNQYGIYDTIGNVLEWCFDWYDERFYEKSPKENPHGSDKTGVYRIIRGGSWSGEDKNYWRFNYRDYLTPNSWLVNLGFRCVKSASKE